MIVSHPCKHEWLQAAAIPNVPHSKGGSINFKSLFLQKPPWLYEATSPTAQFSSVVYGVPFVLSCQETPPIFKELKLKFKSHCITTKTHTHMPTPLPLSLLSSLILDHNKISQLLSSVALRMHFPISMPSYNSYLPRQSSHPHLYMTNF